VRNTKAEAPHNEIFCIILLLRLIPTCRLDNTVLEHPVLEPNALTMIVLFYFWLKFACNNLSEFLSFQLNTGR